MNFSVGYIYGVCYCNFHKLQVSLHDGTKGVRKGGGLGLNPP